MSKNKVVVILDNIRSRENVGSIFRTADAAGVSKLYLCGITPTPMTMKHESWNSNQKTGFKFQDSSDKISKTALGAEKWVPWQSRAKTWQVLRELKSLKFKVVGLENTKNAENVFELKSLGSKSLALLVGNEVRGLSPQILKHCDRIIAIPMRGQKESLNVAVAFGIAIYQMSTF